MTPATFLDELFKANVLQTAVVPRKRKRCDGCCDANLCRIGRGRRCRSILDDGDDDVSSAGPAAKRAAIVVVDAHT
jgi:hypothetical protein